MTMVLVIRSRHSVPDFIAPRCFLYLLRYLNIEIVPRKNVDRILFEIRFQMISHVVPADIVHLYLLLHSVPVVYRDHLSCFVPGIKN